MPEYKPAIGILVWIAGSAVSVLLAVFGVISRDMASYGALASMAIPLIWSVYAP